MKKTILTTIPLLFATTSGLALAGECGPDTMHFASSANAWSTEPMLCENSVWTYTQTFEEAGQFKFTVDAGWAENYGDDDADGIANQNGENINVDSTGEFTIEFDYAQMSYSVTAADDDDTTAACLSDTMFIRGSFNSWEAQAMTCDEGIWASEITATADTAFKFDLAGDWSENYGDDGADGTAAQGEGNIVIGDAGDYAVEFNYADKSYSISILDDDDTTPPPACGTDTMFVRGSFSDWDAIEMACTDGVWTATQEVADDARFKFDVAGDWAENYGDNQPRDGLVDEAGDNIVIEMAGTYNFAFDFIAQSYTLALVEDDDDDTDTPCGTESMYLRGSFNDWETTEMSCVEGIWTATTDVADDARFKFDVAGDWLENYGDNQPRDGMADAAGDNIVIETAGNYTFEFDFAALTYVLTANDDDDDTTPACVTESLNLRGSFNNWEAQAMTCEEGVWTTLATVEAGALVKFDVAGDWAENYGDNVEADGTLDEAGDNIVINDAGTYIFTVDFTDNSYLLTSQNDDDDTTPECGADSLNIRGTFNDWAADEMTCSEEGVFTFVADFEAASEFKFDVLGDWTENYGDNVEADGTLDEAGDNIIINDAGEYTVSVDFAALTYVITASENDDDDEVESCGADSAYIRGSFNDWEATELTCEDGVFAGEVTLGTNAMFKFDMLGDWSENYGDDTPRDGAVDLAGENIEVEDAGTYYVEFDYNEKTYALEAM